MRCPAVRALVAPTMREVVIDADVVAHASMTTSRIVGRVAGGAGRAGLWRAPSVVSGAPAKLGG
jgi:hypothetical protein